MKLNSNCLRGSSYEKEFGNVKILLAYAYLNEYFMDYQKDCHLNHSNQEDKLSDEALGL